MNPLILLMVWTASRDGMIYATTPMESMARCEQVKEYMISKSAWRNADSVRTSWRPPLPFLIECKEFK